MDFLLFNKVFQNFIFSNFNLLQTFNDYRLLRMGPTFLKSFFNFQIFQVFKTMLGWVIVSGFWILDKKKHIKKNFCQIDEGISWATWTSVQSCVYRSKKLAL